MSLLLSHNLVFALAYSVIFSIYLINPLTERRLISFPSVHLLAEAVLHCMNWIPLIHSVILRIPLEQLLEKTMDKYA